MLIAALFQFGMSLSHVEIAIRVRAPRHREAFARHFAHRLEAISIFPEEARRFVKAHPPSFLSRPLRLPICWSLGYMHLFRLGQGFASGLPLSYPMRLRRTQARMHFSRLVFLLGSSAFVEGTPRTKGNHNRKGDSNEYGPAKKTRRTCFKKSIPFCYNDYIEFQTVAATSVARTISCAWYEG